MINAFPFPGRRAQAGEAETRLSAGLAPLARAMFPRGVFRKNAGS